MRIRALLRRSGTAYEQKIFAGDLIADYAAMSVTVNGEKVELTQKEFLLLFKLLSSPGKIFTRNDLVTEIWGEKLEDDHTLNVHINRLREKISKSQSVDVKAVRGLGYKAVINYEKK